MSRVLDEELNSDLAERFERLVTALADLDISSDRFGNTILRHRSGSELVFTTQGDIQVRTARDFDVKTERWAHTNSDLMEISKALGRVIYGPRGEVLRCLG